MAPESREQRAKPLGFLELPGFREPLSAVLIINGSLVRAPQAYPYTGRYERVAAMRPFFMAYV